MPSPESIARTVALRPGRSSDADEILRLFDESVVWLAARGRQGQWGAEPWSTDPLRRERVQRMLADHDPTIAESDGQVVAALVTGRTAPPYIPPCREPELYIHLLISSPALRGSGLGSRLLGHARDLARTAGIGLLRVDSWGGGDRKLVAYYVGQGFTPVAAFDRDGWVGQLYEQRLT